VRVCACMCVYVCVCVCVCVFYLGEGREMAEVIGGSLQHSATHCNTLQHTATHCNTLQRTATHTQYLGEGREMAEVIDARRAGGEEVVDVGVLGRDIVVE